MKPKLEINLNCFDKTDRFTVENSHGESCGVMVTPPIDENYWIFRVKLCKDQSVIGFPKFGMVGVGMALEEDWNTNLPLSPTISPQENAETIANHIFCNKKYKSITKQMVIDAILLIEKGANQYCKKEERCYQVLF
jgi:hypothetical protein